MRSSYASAVGMLCVAAPVWAQEVVPQRRFDVDVTAVTTYDSNLLRLPKDMAPPPGRSREDVRFTPSLTVDFETPVGGRHSVYVTGVAGYDIYLNNEQLNSERLELLGGGNLNLSSCGVSGNGSLSRRQSDFADLLLEDRGKNIETRATYEVRLACRGAGGLRPSFGYFHERVENSDPLRRIGNYSSETFSADIAYQRPVLGELGLGVSATKGIYDERLPGTVGADRVKSYTARATFRREIGSQLTGFVSAGITRVDPDAPDVPGFSGLSWSADLNWNPGTRLQVTAGASREAQQSNLLNISYAIVDSYRAQVTYALGERIRLSLRASQSNRLLRDASSQPGELVSGRDRTSRIGTGVSYMVGRRLMLLMDATAERRRAENEILNYNSYSVALTTRLSL